MIVVSIACANTVLIAPPMWYEYILDTVIAGTLTPTVQIPVQLYHVLYALCMTEVHVPGSGTVKQNTRSMYSELGVQVHICLHCSLEYWSKLEKSSEYNCTTVYCTPVYNCTVVL